jgi:hypothetical protein
VNPEAEEPKVTAGSVDAPGGGDFPPAAAVTTPPKHETGSDRMQRIAAERKIPVKFDEDPIDAREKQEPRGRPVRSNDDIDEAVGLAERGAKCLDWSGPGWVLQIGGRPAKFAVTRWYPHQRVAIDFLRNKSDVFYTDQKKQVLNGLGIVYVALPPRGSLPLTETEPGKRNGLVEIIEDQRTAIASKTRGAVVAPVEA